MTPPEDVGSSLSVIDDESIEPVTGELVEASGASERIEALNPITGVLVAAGDVAGIAEAVQMLRMKKRELDGFIEEFTALAIEESQRMGTRTLRTADYEVVVSADTEIEWDIGMLNEGLSAAGCPEERLYELITQTVTYKVNRAVANQLAKSNPKYAQAIAAAGTRKPTKQYVTVKPA